MKDIVYSALANGLKNGVESELYTVIHGAKQGHRALYIENKWILTHEEDLPLFESARKADAPHGTMIASLEADIFFERITRAPRLCICGGGHVSLQLAKVMALLGFDITVIDEREEFCNPARFPEAKTLCTSFEEGIRTFGPGPNDYFVIITRGHLYDRACLEQVLRGKYAYVGMIGSRSKVAKVFEHMRTVGGFTEEQIASVHSPIGLPIGANTPAEIAVCIAAEIIEVKNKGRGDFGWDEELVNALLALDEPAAMAMIVEKSGSSPRAPGARMLIYRDGHIAGSVGGGDGEYSAIQYGQNAIEHGRAGIYHCAMNNENAAMEGMVCGGTIDVFIQPIE